MDAAGALRLLAAVALLAQAAGARGLGHRRRLAVKRRARHREHREVELEDFDVPFYVSLSDPSTGGRLCAGALIGFSAVATSAHCVDPSFPGGVPHPVAVVGPPGAPAEGVEIRTGARAVLHPAWDGDPLHGHNVAIVILDRPVHVPLAVIPHEEPPGATFSLRLEGGGGADGETCRRPHFLERDPSLRACTGRVVPSPCLEGAGTPLVSDTVVTAPHRHTKPMLAGLLSFADCGSGTPVFSRAEELLLIERELRRASGPRRRGS